MDDEPEIYLFRPADPGDEWRAERERQRTEARRRHLDRLVAVLAVADACTDEPRARAEAVLDALFVVRDRVSGELCPCSCHPQLPETDLHGYGSDCSCRRSEDQRRTNRGAWLRSLEAYWASDEGRAATAAREAEEAALAAWVAAEPGVSITRHGGFAPEQWWGHVDGRSFYFRERHGHWRIELDLVPSGHFVEVWRGGDLDDESSREMTEIETGTVIAEGAVAAAGYGETPVERARFIVDAIRLHLKR